MFLSTRIRRRFIVVSLVALAIGALVTLKLHAQAVQSERARLAGRSQQAPPVNVEVQTITVRPQFADMLELPGTVEPNRVVSVSAEVDGRVEQIRFVEGDRVEAGDVLVELNKDLLRADYERAAANAQYSRTQFERMVGLVARGAATPEERDRAEAAMNTAQADLDAVKARLDRATIASPLDGVLDTLPVEVGEYVTKGSLVSKIVEVGTVKVVVHVPERDVGRFETGDQALVLPHEEAQSGPTGTITYISELSSSLTHTTRMEIAVPNQPRVLRAGQIVRVRLTRRILRDVVVVPLAAVLPLEEGYITYVAHNVQGRSVRSEEEFDDPASLLYAARREVEIGLIQGLDVVITSGLTPGEKIIVRGHRFVGDQQRIAVVGHQQEDAAVPIGTPPVNAADGRFVRPEDEG